MNNQLDWRQDNMYCVIVGDIINSKKIDATQLEEINLTIKETLNYLNTSYMDSILADFGVVRGDAFEGILLTHYQLPKIINEIIKRFYRIEQTKVRICVVLGELSAISTDRNEANGPAFYQANECLTKMKDSKSDHWFQVSILTTSYAQPLLRATLNLLMALTQGWTHRQREIIWSLEDLGEQQHLVSKNLGISTPVVNKQIKAAGYDTYHNAWQSIEEFLINLEENELQGKHNFLAYYGVALRMREQQEYQKAYQMLLQALEIAKDEFHENDPQLILIYHGLAENLIRSKAYQEAEFYVNLSLKVQENLPKARLLYVKTLNIYGTLYLEQGQLLSAEEYYEKALELTVNTFGNSHYYVTVCYNHLADLHRYKRDYIKAINYYEKAISILKTKQQYNPLNLAKLLYHIASCYLERNELQKANKFANEALNIYQNNLASRHAAIKTSLKLIEEIRLKEDMA